MTRILCGFGIHDYKYFVYKNIDYRICECGKLQRLEDDPYNYDHHWLTCSDSEKTADILRFVQDKTGTISPKEQRKLARQEMLRKDIERYYQNEVFQHLFKYDIMSVDQVFVEQQFSKLELFCEIGKELGYDVVKNKLVVLISIGERPMTILEQYEQEC